VLRDCGIRLVGPRQGLTPQLVEEARAHKAALIAYARATGSVALANEALELLHRLKGYTLPAETSLTHVRELVRKVLCGVPTEPAPMLNALQTLEGDLIDLGGAYDPELAETISMIQRALPGARLVRG
jgi:hypothetical protein